jgi:hypothetical protein
MFVVPLNFQQDFPYFTQCLGHFHGSVLVSQVATVKLFCLSFTENYMELGTVVADIFHLRHPAKKGPTGYYYEVYYDIVLVFGLTELQILVAWEEKVRLISWISSSPKFLFSGC